MAVVSYALVLLITVYVTLSHGHSLGATASFGLVLLLIVCIRLASARAFDRLYTPDPDRWRRHFHAGTYASAVVWDAVVWQQMNASGAAWPTWMVLLLSFGLSAGATTTLCPDPSLLNRFLLLQLTPIAAWGMVRGEPYGTVIAIVTAVYCVLILMQARYNSQLFWESILDKEALREAGRCRETLVNSIDGIVWEADPVSMRFTFISVRAETILGYPIGRWLSDRWFWR